MLALDEGAPFLVDRARCQASREFPRVWDADGLRQAGQLTDEVAGMVVAAAEAGLEPRGLVLVEHRDPVDDRRERLCLIVYSPRLVRIGAPRRRFGRPARAARPRLVLVADGSGDVRWWDSSTAGGSLDATDLPLSDELRRELEWLRDAFAEVAGDGGTLHGFDLLEHDWGRSALEARAAALWRRARSELGRQYAVGFLGSHMRRPIWSPDELREDEDDDPESDIPF